MGMGTPKDDAAAARWYFKAAEQGNINGQVLIGRRYQDDLVVPQDYEEAVRWYRKAAERGDPEGQRKLGYMFGLGKGVPRDLVEACKRFNLAASGGDSTAVEMRDRTAKELTRDQIAEAQRLAREFVAIEE